MAFEQPTSGCDEHAEQRVKVLAFAEAVTLAHVARPAALLGQLDAKRYRCVLACDARYAAFVENGPWEWTRLASQSSADFLSALARGAPVHSLQGLQADVREDLRLIDKFKPDLILGDFRLSLTVSARLAGVPYMAISNAYWSPASAQPFPMPVLPMTRLLPLPLASALFRIGGPAVMALHCRPVNRLRRLHGLPSLRPGLRHVYADGDRVLIADAPALFPLAPLPADHAYVGPLLWAPQVPLPDWWEDLRSEQTAVYVALGSSGAAHLLPQVLSALENLPVQVLVSTAGASMPANVPRNVRWARYLPGDAAARRSSLVICNGGSMAVQQALACAVPVLGITGNMDQFMNMAAIVRIGAGALVRADRLKIVSLRALCVRLLASAEAAACAREGQQLQQTTQPASAVFDTVAAELLALT